MRKVAKAVVLVLLISGLFPVLAQQPQAGAKDLVKDLRVAPGKVLAQGSNQTPMGPHQLLTYKLEEVALPKPREIVLRGKKETIESAFRLTITGGEALAGAGIIWIDDAAFPRVWSDGPKLIGTMIYDRSVLRDGAEISVSNLDRKQLYTLPDRLSLPAGLKATIKAPVEEGNAIVLIRSALLIFGSGNRPVIQLHLKTNRKFPVRNAMLELQIGKQFFQNEIMIDADNYGLAVNLDPKVFAELKDGVEVIAFYNSPNRSGSFAQEIWYFGRLNKSLMSRQ